MNKKFIGSSFDESVKAWEKQDPTLRAKIEEYKEKAELAMLLKNARKKESLSQTDLAKMANVPQSVIARIESSNAQTMPRLDLYSKLFNSMGYNIVVGAVKIRHKPHSHKLATA
jgi:ribosome-binding protein aMBF1 (putative translation factor)